MKDVNIFGIKITEDKFKTRMLWLAKGAGEILLSLAAGFAVWLLLSVI